jgi:MFS family permease
MDDVYRKRRDSTFLCFLLIYGALFICRSVLPANLELIKDALDSSRTAIAWVMGIDLLVLTVSMLFYGYFGERIAGKISLKTITQLGWVICFGLISISLNFFQYATFYILSACFRGAFVPLAFTMVGDFYPPDERGSKFGWLNFFLLLGSGVGLIFGSLLGALSPIGWRWAYCLGVIMALASVSMYTLWGISPERGKFEPEFQDLQEVQYDYKMSFSNIKKLFKMKSVAALILSVLVSGIATTTLGIWELDYFKTSQLVILGGSAGLFALLFVILAGLGGLPGNIHGGKLGDKYYNSGNLKGRVTISILGIASGVGCLCGFFLIPLFGGAPWITVLSAILIIGLGFAGYWLASFPVGNQMAIYSEVCLPEVRSTANALHGMMVNIGGAIGNFLLATTITADEVTPIHVAILMAFWLGSGLLWIIPYFTYPREARECREIMSQRRGEMEPQ